MSAVERVFAVPRSGLFGGEWPQGLFAIDADGPLLLQRLAALGSFLQRPQAEEDPSHKQPIPYCVVRRGNEVFTMQRLAAGGETRLHGRRSIGVGGHVGPEDEAHSPDAGLFARALRRELDEELVLPPDLQLAPRLLGVLNDDSNAVGSVHVGLIYELEVPIGTPVRIREIHKLHGGFERLAGPDGLWQDLELFESWSAQLLQGGLLRTGGSQHLGPIPPTLTLKAEPQYGRKDSEHG